MPGHSDWVTGVAVAPNGRVGASSSTDANVVLWDLKGFKKLATIGNRAFVDSLVAFTSDGRYLLTTDAGNALQVYQVDPPQK
jgi:WD40 repeat protein